MSDLQSYLDKAFERVFLEDSTSDVVIEDYDIYQEIAESIISLRAELSLTQGELALMTGISQANISKFENGNSHPSISTLKKIADGVGKRLIVKFVNSEVNG